ncbi:hypothetical protein COW80_05025 [Candidatus Beckwithbacteria bacterium CG22_combo_CG10-13_8_21_14_all_01_47_9]|uniref:N-acetyltransferase domain-containing protein n=5 Tax=Candidatus Beckwithiibacteriota TaxID=1752726 RepID=A0A2H0E175_9BACT|nr:MAG: hypothetical protein AUJ59_02160 [Candidatus Beckwithbacteria bacterium CG1_02_47_37]PIP52651.1 MAG: hypothetical protein COX09_00385 [Candidatus Beckwithbacteria bacterium CG23_combo_of_CG06-09_8_20_14_all_47_9]PIP87590.1 MAG: hypothetical protein COW80_05025 [Candidatus Beckwithbacteria bacterium CG22_combo_CG10-13_8_21_14_all_01_47_9]PJA23213.1 MAG: hypothetical protein COX59_01045 [Candidatus Beckwithbacteria bacterium CG_4_10_14_0_2_um_filter_47_25]PJC66131.1 MAG: hypothetical prot
MLIRRATIKDLPAISGLSLDLFKYERAFTKTYNLKWTYSKIGQDYFTERITKKDGIVFVAQENKKIIGYICGYVGHWFFRIKPKMAEIDNMFVEPKYRYLGVGSKLVAVFMKRVKAMGASRVKVEAIYNNDLARNFYQKNQFHNHTVVLESEF